MSTPKYAIVEKSSLDIKTDIFQGISFSSQYSQAGELLLDHCTIAFNGLVSQISLIPFFNSSHIYQPKRMCILHSILHYGKNKFPLFQTCHMRILQIPTQFFYCAKLYTTARCLPFPIPVIIFKDLFHSVPSVILSSNKQTKKSVSLVVTLVQKPSFCFEKLGFSKINLILSGFFFPSCNLLMGSFYNISQLVFYFSILKNSVLLLKLMALFFTFLTSLSNKITTWIPSKIVASPCCEEKQTTTK